MRSAVPESSEAANGRLTRNVSSSEPPAWVSRTERRSSLPGVSAASTRRRVGSATVAAAGTAATVVETGPAVAAIAARTAAAATAAVRETTRRPTGPG